MNYEQYKALSDLVRFQVQCLVKEGCDAKWDMEHPETSEAYNKGLNDAWELAKNICYMVGSNGEKLSECFGTPFIANVYEMDVKEALQKYKEYTQKAESEPLKVGDEVINQDGYKCIVLYVEDNSEYIVYNKYYHSSYTHYTFSDGKLEKTGKSFPEIAEALRGMEEES